MKEQRINIAEILKDFPKGTKLYSPLFEGDVSLQRIEENTIVIAKGASEHRFFWNGCYHICSSGECMLFPSRDQRDWSKFRKPVTPPFEIKPPKHGEVFFFVNALGEVQKIEDKEHIGVENDSIRMGFELGNYFNTREQAEYAAKKVKELLLSLRKEA